MYQINEEGDGAAAATINEEGASAPANTVGSGAVDTTPAKPAESPRRRQITDAMKAAVAKTAARTFQATKAKK